MATPVAVASLRSPGTANHFLPPAGQALSQPGGVTWRSAQQTFMRRVGPQGHLVDTEVDTFRRIDLAVFVNQAAFWAAGDQTTVVSEQVRGLSSASQHWSSRVGGNLPDLPARVKFVVDKRKDETKRKIFDRLQQPIRDLVAATGGLAVWGTVKASTRYSTYLDCFDENPYNIAKLIAGPVANIISLDALYGPVVYGAVEEQWRADMKWWIRTVFSETCDIIFRHYIQNTNKTAATREWRAIWSAHIQDINPGLSVSLDVQNWPST